VNGFNFPYARHWAGKELVDAARDFECPTAVRNASIARDFEGPSSIFFFSILSETLMPLLSNFSTPKAPAWLVSKVHGMKAR
jgi:hypothetical protein